MRVAPFTASDGGEVLSVAWNTLSSRIGRQTSVAPKRSHKAGSCVQARYEVRSNLPEKYAAIAKDQDDILNPDQIAKNHWHLHTQPRDAWTFELDLRLRP